MGSEPLAAGEKYVFVADVHLSRGRPAATERFLAFLDTLHTERAHLFLLGDIFDYWVNTRSVRAAYEPVLEALGALAADRLMVYFVCGNRDFLLPAEPLARRGIVHLGEGADLKLSGRTVHVTHGYTLCTDDHRFLRYKRDVWPLFRLLDRFLPGPVKEGVAQLAMKRSKQVIGSQSEKVLQVTDGEVGARFRRGADLVVCGHVHRAERRDYEGGRSLILLPPWGDHGGGFAVLEEGGVRLVDVRP